MSSLKKIMLSKKSNPQLTLDDIEVIRNPSHSHVVVCYVEWLVGPPVVYLHRSAPNVELSEMACGAVYERCSHLYRMRAPIRTIYPDYHLSWIGDTFVAVRFDSVCEHWDEGASVVALWREDCFDVDCLLESVDIWSEVTWGELQRRVAEYGFSLLDHYTYSDDVPDWAAPEWMPDYEATSYFVRPQLQLEI